MMEFVKKKWVYNQIWIGIFKWVFPDLQLMEVLRFEECLRSQGFIIALLEEKMGRE